MNKELKKDYDKIRYCKNKSKRSEDMKKYYQRNRNKILEKERKKYEKIKEIKKKLPKYRYKNKKWMKENYLDLNKSANKISKELGVSLFTIYNWLKIHKINCRKNWKNDSGEKISIIRKRLFKEGKLTTWNKGIPNSKETRNKISKSLQGRPSWSKGLTKYTDERLMKMSKINKGVRFSEKHRQNLSKALMGKTKGKKLSEETKKKISEANKGKSKNNLEKNSNWKGGLSFEPYGLDFNMKFKRAIRKRDNQICMLCGIHKEKLKRALCVHHINYDKLLSIKENCLSLCVGCHTKTNFKRKHWITFFQSLLSEKYNYQYSEDNLPIINIETKQ